MKWQKYASETTIHGIPELFRYKSTSFRVAWVSALCLTVILFTYEVYSNVSRYLTYPTAASISYEKKTEFPEITICTNDWIDPRVLRDWLGEDLVGGGGDKWSMPNGGDLERFKEGMRHFLSPICPTVERPSILDVSPLKLVNVSLIPIFQEKLDMAIRSSGGSIAFLRDMAMDFRRVGKATCEACYEREVEGRFLVKDVGVCWQFVPGKLQSPVDRRTRKPSLSVVFQFGNESLLNDQSRFFVYIGAEARISSGAHSAVAVPGKLNDIEFSLAYKTTVRNCNESAGHTEAHCHMQCFRNLEQACHTNCSFFFGNTTVMGFPDPPSPHCNFMLLPFDYACLDRMGEEACAGKCAPPCRVQTVDAKTVMLDIPNHKPISSYDLSKKQLAAAGVTVATKSDVIIAPSVPVDLVIKLDAANIFSVMEFTEYYSYTASNLVSDFGGLLGLFLGASVISLMHTLYFCCVLPFANRRADDGSDEGTGESE